MPFPPLFRSLLAMFAALFALTSLPVHAQLMGEIVVDLPTGSPSSVTAWGRNDLGQTNVPANLEGAKAVASGLSHAVALKEDGTVVAWGSNTFGQSAVPAGLTGVTAIAAGGYHTAALKSDGTVVAWGDSQNGFGESIVPSGLAGVVAISAGSYHTLALKNDGTVVSWGRTMGGLLDVPAGLSGVVAVAAADAHNLALENDGTVIAWGWNVYNQCSVPAGLTGVVAVAAGGYHSLALKSDGTVVAWGWNDYGQGVVPADVSGVIAIAAGAAHSVVIRANGIPAAWGRNDFGQCNVPVDLNGVTAIAAGEFHTVALSRRIDFAVQNIGTTSPPQTVTIRNTGTSALLISSVSMLYGNVNDFAVNTSGMLTSVPPGGQTTFSVTFSPNTIGTYRATLRVASSDSDESNYDITVSGVGGVSKVLVTQDGTSLSPQVLAWGSNAYGQTNVPPGLRPTAISAGALHTAVVQDDGTVVAWGVNADGQCNVPSSLSGVKAVAAGGWHTVALKYDGTAIAWGHAGDGKTSIPAGLSNLKAIAAGLYHTMALKSDGTVVAWGWNGDGQCTVPVGLSGVIAIAAGSGHSVALKSDGTVVAWGWNGYGQCTVPGGLTGVTAIAAGYGNTMALRNDGTVAVWGSSQFGTLNVPSQLPFITKIAAGYFNSLAIGIDGRGYGVGYGWGNNDFTKSSVPQVGYLTDISAGSDHGVALWSLLVSFGTQRVWTSSGPRTFVIKNAGTAPLDIYSIFAVSGSQYIVDTTGMLTHVPPGGQTAFTVTFIPRQPNSAPFPADDLLKAVIRIHSNERAGIYDINVLGSATRDEVTSLQYWRRDQFGTGANIGEAADGFDYDKDGLPNLLEYAFGLNPKQASSAQLPALQSSGGNLFFSFAEPAGATTREWPITYRAEWSRDLVTWQNVPDTGTVPQHLFSVPTAGEPKLYMRMRITSPGF